MRSLTVLVPVLNESLLIDEFLAKTTRDLVEGGLDWELILIDDGSKDDSLDKMQRFSKTEPRVKVISLGANHGPGANYHRGFGMASKDHVCWATVDAFYDTAILARLMELFDRYSAVSAYRTDLAGHTPVRRLQTLTNNLILRTLFPQFQFRAYHTLQIHRSDFIRSIRIEAVTPFMCSELLFKAQALGLKIKEVGIEYLPRKKGKATGGKPQLILRYLAEMTSFWSRWVLFGHPIVDPSISIPERTPEHSKVARVTTNPDLSWM